MADVSPISRATTCLVHRGHLIPPKEGGGVSSGCWRMEEDVHNGLGMVVSYVHVCTWTVEVANIPSKDMEQGSEFCP